MENKIIRECVQGLINDSKMIDEICEKYRVEREHIIAMIDGFYSESHKSNKETIDITWFNEKMIEIGKSLSNASNAIDDVRSNADNAKYEASYAYDNCDDAEGYLDDAKNTFRDMQTELEKAESNNIEDATQNEETVTSN